MKQIFALKVTENKAADKGMVRVILSDFMYIVHAKIALPDVQPHTLLKSDQKCGRFLTQKVFISIIFSSKFF